MPSIFCFNAGFVGFVVLGAVFLTVTGAEALYADLGHFGRKPIQWAWICLVFPSLALNYLGQGAMVLKHPEAMSDPFYLMFPEWALLPVVILATAATIIASQAVITGAFSLTRQAIHLGFLPRMEIFHTSETKTGQIYLPAVNMLLLFGVMVLVFIFGSSESAGHRLWHLGHRRDGRRYAARLRIRPRTLEMAALCCGRLCSCRCCCWKPSSLAPTS